MADLKQQVIELTARAEEAERKQKASNLAKEKLEQR